MAKNLIDALKQQINTRETADAGTSSASIADRLNRKATGKATTGSGPRVQSSQAVAATSGIQTQLNQQSQQNQVAAQNLGIQQEAQQAGQEQQQLNFVEQGRQLQQGIAQQQAQLVNDLNQNLGQLDQQQQQHNIEQLGASLALQDEQYLHALQLEGSRRRLDNENDFKIELQASVFKDMEAVLSDKIELDNILKADAREFSEMLAKIDIQTAVDLAKDQARSSAFSGAVSAFGSAAGSYFGDQASKKEDK